MSLIDAQYAHIEKLVEICVEKYGNSVQQKLQFKKTSQNKKKESRKRKIREQLIID